MATVIYASGRRRYRARRARARNSAQSDHMLLNLRHIGQIALPVTDVDRSEVLQRHARVAETISIWQPDILRLCRRPASPRKIEERHQAGGLPLLSLCGNCARRRGI